MWLMHPLAVAIPPHLCRYLLWLFDLWVPRPPIVHTNSMDFIAGEGTRGRGKVVVRIQCSGVKALEALALKPSSRTLYKECWKVWLDFCKSKSLDPYVVSNNVHALFLARLYAHSTITLKSTVKYLAPIHFFWSLVSVPLFSSSRTNCVLKGIMNDLPVQATSKDPLLLSAGLPSIFDTS